MLSFVRADATMGSMSLTVRTVFPTPLVVSQDCSLPAGIIGLAGADMSLKAKGTSTRASTSRVRQTPSSKFKLLGFNPIQQRMSNADILFELVRVFGPGITRIQMRQILRKCIACHGVCFVERLHLHSCTARILEAGDKDFDFIRSMTSYEEHRGLRESDLVRLFMICDLCNHVGVIGTAQSLHCCPNARL